MHNKIEYMTTYEIPGRINSVLWYTEAVSTLLSPPEKNLWKLHVFLLEIHILFFVPLHTFKTLKAY